jgi:hypothetical protein
MLIAPVSILVYLILLFLISFLGYVMFGSSIMVGYFFYVQEIKWLYKFFELLAELSLPLAVALHSFAVVRFVAAFAPKRKQLAAILTSILIIPIALLVRAFFSTYTEPQIVIREIWVEQTLISMIIGVVAGAIGAIVWDTRP